MARFVKESSLSKREMFPDIDHMDVMARQETITSIRGEPVLLQLPVVPCYAITVHKSQSLSIKHKALLLSLFLIEKQSTILCTAHLAFSMHGNIFDFLPTSLF